MSGLSRRLAQAAAGLLRCASPALQPCLGGRLALPCSGVMAYSGLPMLGAASLATWSAAPAMTVPSFAAQPLLIARMSTAADGQGSKHDGGGKQGMAQRMAQEAERDLVAAEEDERARAITDKIPVRPVGVVEGTSYTLAIVAALAFAGAVLWAAVNELLLEPKEYKCFNLALEKLRADPRVTVRLGTPVTGYGSESRNRGARQRVPHRVFTDANGVERIQVQFYARGPSDVGRVSAELYKDGKDYRFAFLFVDIEGRVPQRIMLVEPQPAGIPAVGY